jgi:hypothetical protein
MGKMFSQHFSGEDARLMLISSTSNGSGTNGMAPSLLAENSKKRKKMKHSIIHLTKPNRDPASYRSQKI